MASKTRSEGRNQGTPVSKEIRRAAARMGRVAAPEDDAVAGIPDLTHDDIVEMVKEERAAAREGLLTAIEGVVSQGLHIDDEQENLRYERAIMHVAAAQLRAIKLASITGDDANDAEWQSGDDGFSSVDAGMALAGVIAMLKHGPALIQYLRDANRGAQ